MSSERLESTENAARMCPACACDSMVYRSMELPNGSILRKRRCKKCGAKFETLEKFYRALDMADGN